MAGTFSKLLVHVVFSTKNRASLISKQWQNELYQYMGGIIRSEEATLIEIGGTADHVHLLVQTKPIHTLSGLLKAIKGKSSKWVNDQKEKYRKFGWQDGYAAFTVSESQARRVVDYIHSQEEHHKKIDFKAEFIALLKKHDVEYKEEYLWG
ncbi:MAG: IS200/IS605 family transposase [Planctomycetia bacterium]|jgi:REP element-mobilizing transposase RayT